MRKSKEEIQARKRIRREKYGVWRPMTWISGILSVIMIIATLLLSVFDNTFTLLVNDTFWELENKDANAVYFKSDFISEEERITKGYELVKKVEAEGATLLLNDNQALPLADGAKVSLFSTSSVNLVYGGTGSANVDASKAKSLKVALEDAGLQVNKTLWDFYLLEENEQYLREVGSTVTVDAAVTTEMPWDVYSKKVLESVKEYNDAVIVTISRVGGEGSDLEFLNKNYLALDDNEKDMFEHLAQMKEDGTIGKLIVLINSSNPLQVDFLKDNTYGIDAVLWIGGVGCAGIDAVGEILVGKINPSGSLVDTYCYDNYSSPAMKNFVPTIYEGFKDGIVPDHAKSYMIYQEGIYVGYKYYETRYEDYVLGQGNAGTYTYSNDVAFPFGYGLSYTSFAYSDMTLSYDENTTTYTINVKVTNTGERAGKETVQIYVSSPYTQYDIANKVEKASVSLVGFDKTEILEPGASEVLTIEVDGDYVASYDAYGAGTYILDAGDYYFTAATDAHDAVNNVLAAKGKTTENTDGRMDSAGNGALVCKWNNPKLDTTTFAVSDAGVKIENQLSDSDINLNNGVEQKVTYLTRNDWMGTMPSDKAVKLSLTEYLIAALQEDIYDASKYEKVDMPVLGAENGLKLYDMIGLSYDDSKWEKLLDQLSYKDMVSLVGDAFHWTMPVESVQAPGSRDENGPQGLTLKLFGLGMEMDTAALTSEDVMAATFNKDLVYEIGNIVGNDCLAANISFLYGPGANTHRTPYGGRNFEYYSEDSFLASEIGRYEVKGIEDKGIRVTIKHFALNDCEQDRIGLGVWLTEQAAREIYLRAFQGALEDSQGSGNGVMMAYTRWGTLWSGANSGLVRGIMNEEWNCNGLQVSDNVITTMVDGPNGVMGGTTAYDAMLVFFITGKLEKLENDPVMVNALREACHKNLYAVANSSAMNGIGPNTTIKVIIPSIVRTAMMIREISLIIFVVCVAVMFKKSGKCDKILCKNK